MSSISLLRRRLPVTAVIVYTAALIATTTLFFFLHYLGNQVPYDLAAQRFQTQFHPQRLDAGFVEDKRISARYCDTALFTLAGADQPGVPDEHWLLDALALRSLAVIDGPTACHQVDASSGGSATEAIEWIKKPRYWWGNKALFAIMLQGLSVLEIRDLIRWGTAVGYIALTAAILLLAPRALLVLAPLIVLGSLFSGVKYYSDASSGLPYTYTVWALAWLAVLANPRVIPKMPTKARARILRLSCFLTGTVSSYLWLFEGHTIFIITGIGMVVYFGHPRISPAVRSKLAGWCIALFIVGFAASTAMGQITKVTAAECRIPDWFGWRQACEETGITMLRVNVPYEFRNQVRAHFKRMNLEFREDISGGISQFPILKHFEPFYVIGLGSAAVGRVLTPLLTLATLASIAFAVLRARRGRSRLLWDISWIVGLMILAALQFLLPNDEALRIGRYVFVLYALGVSCSALALMHANILPRVMNRVSALTPQPHSPTRPSDGLCKLARWAGALILATALYLYSLPLQSPLDRAAEIGSPVIQSNFDVYLDGDKMIYVREQCSPEDIRTPFFLHIVPADVADLPEDRQKYGFDNLDFDFYEFATVRRGETCGAVRKLPNYQFTGFSTGQLTGSGTVWSGAFHIGSLPTQPPWQRAEEIGSPVIQSNFDVYLDGNELIYIKQQCSPEDVLPRFFLHVVPADVADLPDDRRQHSFDNLDFDFYQSSAVQRDGACYAVRKLPDYQFIGFRTGQFTKSGTVWSGAFDPDSLPTQPPWQRVEEIGAPVIQSNFDVYLDGDELIYIKEQCSPEDVRARFFIHVVPADAADLADDRRQHGFDNLDFEFIESSGLRRGDACWVVRKLPDYEFTRFSTGQFTESGTVWSGAFVLGGESGLPPPQE